MSTLFLGLFVAGCVLAIIIALTKRRVTTVSVREQKLASLDRMIAARGVDADVFVDTKPVEINVRGTRARDGVVAFNAIGAVAESFKRLSTKSRLIVKDGVLRIVLDDSTIEQWLDGDLERAADDIYTVVTALQRRAATEAREASKPNVWPTQPTTPTQKPKDKGTPAHGTPTLM